MWGPMNDDQLSAAAALVEQPSWTFFVKNSQVTITDRFYRTHTFTFTQKRGRYRYTKPHAEMYSCEGPELHHLFRQIIVNWRTWFGIS